MTTNDTLIAPLVQSADDSPAIPPDPAVADARETSDGPPGEGEPIREDSETAPQATPIISAVPTNVEGDTQEDPGREDHGSIVANGEDEETDLVQIHAQRKSKTRQERKKCVGGKAGNQGRFRADIQEFLLTYVDVYQTIDKGKKGRNNELEEFWHMIRSAFWVKFTVNDARIGMPQDGEGLTPNKVVESTNEVSIFI